MIFFSYSRKDADVVLDIAKTLRSAGANIWLDQLDIAPGSSWDDTIEDALQESNTLLVFLSKTSVASQNVRDEYSFAIDENKRIVPVLLEECTVPFRLRRLQYADFSGERETGIATLIDTLELNSDVAAKLKVHSSNASNTNPVNSKKTHRLSSNTLRYGAYIIGGIITLYLLITKTGWFQASTGSQLTVLVHDVSGKDQLVLPNRGQVKLIYGDANVVETLNNKGEATFKQIPKMFFKSGATVEIVFIDPEGEPYRSIHRDSLYTINQDSYISLPVKLYGLGEISGIVKDFDTGDPIDSVRVSILGREVWSNEFGEYKLSIPSEEQKKYQTIRAFKEGYQFYEISNVPIQTDQELPIMLKQKRSD